MVATPGLLQRHLDHHRRHPEENEALIGLVTWAPELDITPHMLWLEDGGPLFSFNTIDDPDDVDWRHFCTANVSVKRAFLPSAHPFDEDLRRCVDIELGYRLSRSGHAAALRRRGRGPPPAGGHPRQHGGAHARGGQGDAAGAREAPRARRAAAAVHASLSHVKAAMARPVAPGAAAARLARRSTSASTSYRAARGYARGYAEAGSGNGGAPE